VPTLRSPARFMAFSFSVTSSEATMAASGGNVCGGFVSLEPHRAIPALEMTYPLNWSRSRVFDARALVGGAMCVLSETGSGWCRDEAGAGSRVSRVRKRKEEMR
jgi:hypothetical protein